MHMQHSEEQALLFSNACERRPSLSACLAITPPEGSNGESRDPSRIPNSSWQKKAPLSKHLFGWSPLPAPALTKKSHSGPLTQNSPKHRLSSDVCSRDTRQGSVRASHPQAKRNCSSTSKAVNLIFSC